MVGGAETQNKQVADPECADKEPRGIEGVEPVDHTTNRWVPCPITFVSSSSPTNVNVSSYWVQGRLCISPPPPVSNLIEVGTVNWSRLRLNSNPL